jgi:hypothetical protein
MQALVKALQAELVTAAVEGDLGLLQAVCREAGKAVQLVSMCMSDLKTINPTRTVGKE